MKAFMKIIFAIFLTFKLFLLSYLLGLLIKNPWTLKRYRIQCVHWISKVFVKCFGVKIKKETIEPTKEPIVDSESSSFFIVSNHLSYLDTFIIAAHYPCCFVTSQEMKATPFLGTVCVLAGCVFVERRNKNNITREIQELTEALQMNLHVCVFPEATSTNGDSVLRFRKPLYHAALQAQRPILPLCLNYESINHQPITSINRDLVCWYDQIPFIKHFITFLKQTSFEVELKRFTLLQVEQNATVDQLAQKTHSLINQYFKPFR